MDTNNNYNNDNNNNNNNKQKFVQNGITMFKPDLLGLTQLIVYKHGQEVDFAITERQIFGPLRAYWLHTIVFNYWFIHLISKVNNR